MITLKDFKLPAGWSTANYRPDIIEFHAAEGWVAATQVVLSAAYQRSTGDVRVSALEERVSILEAARSSFSFAVLNTLGKESLRLAKPLGITLDLDEGGIGLVTAKWTEALLEGEGKSQTAALEALREAIVDAYEDLREAQAQGLKLAGHPAALWRLLNEFVITDAAATRER